MNKKCKVDTTTIMKRKIVAVSKERKMREALRDSAIRGDQDLNDFWDAILELRGARPSYYGRHWYEVQDYEADFQHTIDWVNTEENFSPISPDTIKWYVSGFADLDKKRMLVKSPLRNEYAFALKSSL